MRSDVINEISLGHRRPSPLVIDGIIISELSLSYVWVQLWLGSNQVKRLSAIPYGNFYYKNWLNSNSLGRSYGVTFNTIEETGNRNICNSGWSMITVCANAKTAVIIWGQSHCPESKACTRERSHKKSQLDFLLNKAWELIAGHCTKKFGVVSHASCATNRRAKDHY